jgi:hypothetical protein
MEKSISLTSNTEVLKQKYHGLAFVWKDMNTTNNFNQATNMWVEAHTHILPDMNQLTGCFV